MYSNSKKLSVIAREVGHMEMGAKSQEIERCQASFKVDVYAAYPCLPG